MNLYAVRHGRTGDNEAGIAADSSSELNELGISQAISAADRLQDVDLGKIFSSPAKRTIDTARHIAQKHSLKIEITNLLEEYRRPSEMVGIAHESLEAQKIYNEISENMENRAWHYSDEENYYEFRDRVLKFMKSVENEKAENILAVSHSLVIRLMACLVVFGNNMTASQFYKARWNMKIFNAGVTVFRFEGEKWCLLTFNDIAHLAD